MTCEKTPWLERLVVENPQALQEPQWQTHFETCALCHHTAMAYQHSLAAYLQVERQQMAHVTPPSWQTFSQTLAHQPHPASVRSKRWLSVLGAVAALLLMVGGDVLHEELRHTSHPITLKPPTQPPIGLVRVEKLPPGYALAPPPHPSLVAPTSPVDFGTPGPHPQRRGGWHMSPQPPAGWGIPNAPIR